jgi:Mg-chelatase subunit ChlD
MIPDLPPMNREDLEAKVTALLLGELPPDEAALLRELIARDAGLARLHDRLKPTLALLRETMATPEVAPAVLPKLSPERREKLLAQFKTVAPKEFVPASERKTSWLFALAAVASIMILASMMLPALSRAKVKKLAARERAELSGTKEAALEVETQVPATSEPSLATSKGGELDDKIARLTPRPAESRSPSRIVLPGPVVEDQQSLAVSPANSPKRSEPASVVTKPGMPLNAFGRARRSLDFGGTQANNGKAEAESSTDQQFSFGVTASNNVVLYDSPEAPVVVTLGAADPDNVRATLSSLFKGGPQAVSPGLPGGLGGREEAQAINRTHLSQRSTANANAINSQSIGGTIAQVTTSSPVGESVPLLGNTPAAGALLADKESKSAAIGSTIDRPGNGRVGSANFSLDKDSGKLSVTADVQTTRSTFANNLIPNTSVANAGMILDDRKKNAILAVEKSLGNPSVDKTDAALPQPVLAPPIPQPEVLTSTNIFSTFSLNVSDTSFKLAAASLQNGVMPDAARVRSEEFINAFDYRDPEPAPGAPIGFAWERAGYPFAHNRDLLRFSVKTAAQGRQDGRPLNLVLLLDKSGSMERADRVEIIQQALRVLASQLHPQDTLSVVVFARTARLWVDGVPGSQAGEVVKGLNRLTPEGGTDLEEAMKLAYATALRHYTDKGDNRVVLLTDGAANLGDVKPETLQQKVEANRKQGIALDCFGVGWDGYNDNLMETLSRAGHGRYGFINTPEEAATEFAGKLAGALRVAASDVKVQVEFNPNRVTAYRQIGYAKHQLTKEQFRDNTVAAAQIGAAESGNALYTVEVNSAGDGPLCTVRVRFRLPGTTDYQEHAWDVPYTGTAVALDQASPAMRLAAAASAFSEWLAGSPYAGEVTPDQLLADLRGVPEVYGVDPLPKKLEWMIRQAKSISGK